MRLGEISLHCAISSLRPSRGVRHGFRVLGIGSGMRELLDEFQRLKEHQFTLNFTYPDEAQRQQLRLLHRDIAEGEQMRLETRQQELMGFVSEVRSGVILMDDLDPEIVAELRDLLSS